MSEINGQLFGILLVIGIFGVVAGAVTVVVNNLTTAIEEKSNEIVNEDFTEISTKMFTIVLNSKV